MGSKSFPRGCTGQLGWELYSYMSIGKTLHGENYQNNFKLFRVLAQIAATFYCFFSPACLITPGICAYFFGVLRVRLSSIYVYLIQLYAFFFFFLTTSVFPSSSNSWVSLSSGRRLVLANRHNCSPPSPILSQICSSWVFCFLRKPAKILIPSLQ